MTKLANPYFRIMRFTDWGYPTDFICHKAYAKDRYVLVYAYKMIENDLKKIFEFIEPSEGNLDVYSHRLYELFLRAATEFETNCKQILDANGYSRSGDLNIVDYFKINQAMRLSKYEVRLSMWYPDIKIIKPFEQWASGASLTWYQEYNLVKHHRSENFNKASLRNVIQAVAGLAAILFAQFQVEIFDPFNDSCSYSKGDGFYYDDDILFSVNPCSDWLEGEQYDESCASLPDDNSSFRQFTFL